MSVWHNEFMRIVLHIDMDSFFASIEERDHPRLVGRPIVVGADPKNGKGRGVVSTANYPAREYGIKSALPISRAWDYSQKAKQAGKPEVVFMDVDMAKYTAVSRDIMSYLASQGDSFQPASVDEAYLEINKTYKEAEKLADKIKNYIKRKFKLTCSIGVGPNKLIAKIAVDENKPDGITLIKKKDVQTFLDPKSIRVIPGIGPKTEQALFSLNVKTVKDLRGLTKDILRDKFGKRGEDFYSKARGIDDAPVEPRGEAKSISKEITFDKDSLDPAVLLPAFKEVITKIGENIKKEDIVFKTVTVVVRFENFQTSTRGNTLDKPTGNVKVLETEVMKLILPFFDTRENPKRKRIRLIGVRISSLSGK